MTAPNAPGAGVTRQRYKVVVLGAPSAGKTALVRRLADGSFVEGPRPRGLDFYTCHIALRDDVTVALQLWDLSDCPCRPDDDHAPLAAYIFNSQAVLFVYDVSCPESLEAARYTLRAVEATADSGSGGGAARPYLALVANKCDQDWHASESLARELVARHGCVRYTLSARSGQGVAAAAARLACDLAGVPLAAATEQHAVLHNLQPGGRAGPPLDGWGLDGTPAARGAGRQQQGAGAFRIAPVAATAAEVAPPLRQQWQVASGKFHSRAPAYHTSAQPLPPPQPLQGPINACGLEVLGMYGMAGSGDEPPWRPINPSTAAASPAVTLISKMGSLRQCTRAGSPLSPPQPAALGDFGLLGFANASCTTAARGDRELHDLPTVRDAATAGVLSERRAPSLPPPPGGLERRQRTGWANLVLCCFMEPR